MLFNTTRRARAPRIKGVGQLPPYAHGPRIPKHGGRYRYGRGHGRIGAFMATLDSPVFSMTEPQVKKAARTLEQAWLRRKERKAARTLEQAWLRQKERRWQRALVHMRRAWACRPALQRSPSKIREALSQCFGEDLAAHIELQGAAVTLTRRARSLVDFLSKGPTCDERAIRIVTEQCQCSRIRAIKALKRNGGGVVDAIMWQIWVR